MTVGLSWQRHAGADLDQVERDLCTALATAVFQRHEPASELNWCAAMYDIPEARDAAAQHFRACCTDPKSSFAQAASSLGVQPGSKQEAQLLALRGMLACGVLTHCLKLRFCVDYGINTKCATPLHLLKRGALGLRVFISMTPVQALRVQLSGRKRVLHCATCVSGDLTCNVNF